MKSLLVIYDSSIADKSRDSYLKGIKKTIPDVKTIDVKNRVHETKIDADKILVLNPLNYIKQQYFYHLLIQNPEKDIEGVATGELTITANAITKTISNKANCELRGKTVVIINQSSTVGIPLAKFLIELGFNVISLNSQYPCIERLLANTKVDILVSASGNDKFKIAEDLTKDIDIKIDLSDDLLDKDKITSIPTIQVLKDRLNDEEDA